MDLKDIAAVSGKGGLFKVLKPTRTGVILEALDQNKSKLIANANNRVSLLKEISIYTTGKESSVALEEVFDSIYKKYGKSLAVNGKSENNQLQEFMKTVVPDYDLEKVYHSDIKKLVTWYALVVEFFPEKFEEKKEESSTEGEVKKETKTKAKSEKTEDIEPAKKEASEDKKEKKSSKPAAEKKEPTTEKKSKK